MLRFIPLVLILVSPLAAQGADEGPSETTAVFAFPASRADSTESLDSRRWRTARTVLASTGGYVTLGLIGGVIGFHLDSSGCGDVCFPDGMVIGWAVGSTVGAGLGAHLGSGGNGSRTWTLVGAGVAQGALAFYGVATDNPVPIIIPVSILAATIANRVSASR